jgi:hypothetical protein
MVRYHSVVWFAYDEALRKLVAIKMYPLATCEADYLINHVRERNTYNTHDVAPFLHCRILHTIWFMSSPSKFNQEIQWLKKHSELQLAPMFIDSWYETHGSVCYGFTVNRELYPHPPGKEFLDISK